jgi:hypothetical protein
VTDEQPLAWLIDEDSGRRHPDCPACSDQYTCSLYTALEASAVEHNMSTADRVLVYFNDFHGRGHPPF